MKRVLFLVLSFAVAGGAAFAAGAEEGAAAEKEVALQFLAGTSWTIPPDVDVNDNEWADIYSEAFPNVSIEWIIVPGNAYDEKKNLLIAANEFPDLMQANDAVELRNWVDQGFLLPTDGLYNTVASQLKSYHDPEAYQLQFYKDHVWTLGRPINPLQNPMHAFIRMDWLENVGMDVPTTTEELFEVLKAFTFDDPDGNGRNDTFGTGTIANLRGFDDVFLAFGVQNTAGNNVAWQRVDGELIPDIIRPEMKDALAYIRRLIAEGVFDPESLLLTGGGQILDKMSQERYGYGHWYTYGILNRVNPATREKGEDRVFTLAPPITGPAGYRGVDGPDLAGLGGGWVISYSCENPETVGEILNWLGTPDESKDYASINADRILLGELNVHHKIVNGWPVTLANDEKTEQAIIDDYRYAYRIVWGVPHVLDTEQLAEYHRQTGNPEFADAIAMTGKYGVGSQKANTGPIESEALNELVTFFDEVKMQIVTGTKPVDEFDKWVDYFYSHQGREIIAEANELNPQLKSR